MVCLDIKVSLQNFREEKPRLSAAASPGPSRFKPRCPYQNPPNYFSAFGKSGSCRHGPSRASAPSYQRSARIMIAILSPLSWLEDSNNRRSTLGFLTEKSLANPLNGGGLEGTTGNGSRNRDALCRQFLDRYLKYASQPREWLECLHRFLLEAHHKVELPMRASCFQNVHLAADSRSSSVTFFVDDIAHARATAWRNVSHRVPEE